MTVDLERVPPCLIRYLRTIDFLEKSIKRWGRDVCWAERAFERVMELEREVDECFRELLPPEEFIWLRAYIKGFDNLRLMIKKEQVRYGIEVGSAVQRSRVQGRGGVARHAKSAIAKQAARDMWPKASRKGWTAAQFHKELTDAGHAVPFDTSRKWLTKLRKTGTC